MAYEHLITLKYELDILRRRKWGATTWIFMFNRYLLLANVVFSNAPISPQASSAILLVFVLTTDSNLFRCKYTLQAVLGLSDTEATF